MDQFYTPPEIARHLVSFAQDPEPGTLIADFAAGMGELLHHASVRWPTVPLLANDADPRIARFLRSNRRGWSVGCSNFLSSRSRFASPVLRNAKGRVGLALLNPPFTCRGGSNWEVECFGERAKCGLALKFVFNALEYLAPAAELIAVLPAGSLQSQKDADACSLLSKIATMRVLGENSTRAFKGCFVKTVLVRLRPTGVLQSCLPTLETFKGEAVSKIVASLHRGVVKMSGIPAANKGRDIPLIHTTELKENSVCLLSRKTGSTSRVFVGPGVLLPRVGRPDHRKLALYLGDSPIALSECVLGIGCRSTDDAFAIFQKLIARWSAVASSYRGTCAPYLTVLGLKHLLAELEISGEQEVVVHERSKCLGDLAADSQMRYVA